MTPSCALLSALVLLAPGPFATLDEALRALDAGETLRGRVTRPIAIEAAGKIDARSPGPRIDRYARVAWAGGAHLNAGTRLLDHLIDRGPADAVALAYLEQLRPRTLNLALEGRREAWWQRAGELATESDPSVGKPAAALLVRDAPPRVIGARLRDLLADRAQGVEGKQLLWVARLVDAAPRSRAPAELLATLLEFELPPVIRKNHRAALEGLTQASEAAANLLLDRVDRGDANPLAILTLSGLPERFREPAREQVFALLDQADPELLPAAVEAAGALELPELVPLFPELVDGGQPTAVRVAAIGAMPRVLRYGLDAGTLDRLLTLQGDPDPAVREAAFQALRAASGETFPNRPELWRQWRDREPAYAGTKRLRRTGGGGGGVGRGSGIVGGRLQWGLPPKPAPTITPRTPEGVNALAPAVALGGGILLLALFAGLALARDDTSPLEALRLRRLALGSAEDATAPRPTASMSAAAPAQQAYVPKRKRRGAQAWSESFSRKQVDGATPARPLSGTEKLERLVSDIELQIPEPGSKGEPREGPSPWTMKLKRLVGGGGLKVYQEDEELDLPEFVSEAFDADEPAASDDVASPEDLSRTHVASPGDPSKTHVASPGDLSKTHVAAFANQSGINFVDSLDDAISGDTARVPAPRAPTATRTMSRLLSDSLDGGISAIIAAAKAESDEPEEPEEEDRWARMERERAEEEARLSGAFRRLPSGEARKITEEAKSLIPGDIDPKSRLYDDALRIRIHHLMREHKLADEPSPADLAEQSLAASGEQAKGKITAIIEEAARRGRTETDDEGEAHASFAELRKARSAVDHALWAEYEELPRKDMKAIRKQADGLVPADLQRGSEAYSNALRLRILHLMRQRKEEQALAEAEAKALEEQFMAAQEEEATGITAIIEAARGGKTPSREEQEAHESFQELRKDRSGENLQLLAELEALDKEEAAELRDRARKLVPQDLAPGSLDYHTALELRLVHLMRERKQKGAFARPSEDELSGQLIAAQQAELQEAIAQRAAEQEAEAPVVPSDTQAARFEALTAEREAENAALWETFEAMQKAERRAVEKKAKTLLPDGLSVGSSEHEEALRLRILLVLREQTQTDDPA